MSAPKKISDSDLEGLLRAARPIEPAPLDPDRAHAIFEKAIALAKTAEAEPAPATAGNVTSWWERLRTVLALPSLSPARLAWGAAAGVAFAAVVLLVSVAITGSDRPGGGQSVATNTTPAANVLVPENGASVAAPRVSPDEAIVDAASKEIGAARLANAAPDSRRRPGKPEKSGSLPAARPYRSGLVAAKSGPAARKGSRKAHVPRAQDRQPDLNLPILDEEPPVLMVASNLPQGEDSERLTITVREDVPADLPGYAEAASLREVPAGPAGPAGVPGTEGPASPSGTGLVSNPVQIVWAECQVHSGSEPTVVYTPVVAPSPAELYEPLPEPVPDPAPEP